MRKINIYIVAVLIANTYLASDIALSQIPLTEDISAIDYSNPKEYTIGGITITGTQYLDPKVLVMLSGLNVGDKISVPGEEISKSIKNLWKQGLFSDISIAATKIQGDNIFLNFQLLERPRLSKFSFSGIKKSEADDLREKIKLIRGKIITENLIMTTKNTVKNHFTQNGYMNTSVELVENKDTASDNSVMLNIKIEKNKKTKINQIIISGNTEFKDKKLKSKMKKTKEKKRYRIFTASKFIESEYENDKNKIIALYNDKGYRDASIVKDTVYDFNYKTVNIEITIDEGKKFYFRNISWLGNTKYTSKELNEILGIKKGEVYDQSLFNSKLYMNPNGKDVSSLYLDDGYLFFNIDPVEALVEGDSVDLEMRIYEGKQATIRKITITGNTKTNDHVIMREIRTKPGQLFRRSDIIRSHRELAQLGYFDPEKLNVLPKPNPKDGTVDIEYVVEERSSDQIELSGGWGGGRVVGSFGVSFNNFAAKRFFKKDAWTPLPGGDGQRLSLRASSNGNFFQSYNASFTEPWLGGKNPNSFSVSVYQSVQTNGLPKTNENRESLKTTGASLGLGKRLKWPDDYFTSYSQLGFQNYDLKNFSSVFAFSDGVSNTLSFSQTFSRNSIDQPIFPRTGAEISLTMQFTPPFSAFDKVDDYSTLTSQQKYKWNEFHKWKFKVSWFSKLAGNLVLNTRMQFGFLGYYNKNLGVTPFERFYVGGSGLSGFQLDGRDIIALRGYDDGYFSQGTKGSIIYNKYTFEMRYPVSLNPNATIYGLAFAEAGNAWTKFRDFKPFEIKRSVGFGLRIFLPMFGLLGFDFGYGFDNPNKSERPQTHFVIGYSIE